MTDVTLDRYLIWGTASDRAAFTPDPGVGTTGTNILPIWQDSDVAGNPAWTWDTATSAWIPFLAAGSSSRQLWQYKAKTTATSGYPGDGFMLWNNATQTSATDLLFSHITSDGLDIDLFLALLASGDTVIVQDSTASADYQEWTISGAPVNTNPGLANSYWTLPVTLVGSGGTGTTNFSNNERLIAVIYAASGAGGITALTGDVTATGPGSAAATIASNAVTTGKINNAAVTLAKIAAAGANSKLLGSGAAGSGSAYVELTLGTNLSMSGTTLNATGGGGTPGGSSGDIQYNNAGAFGGFTMSGDVTVVTSTGVSTIGALKIATGMIQANAVTGAKLSIQAATRTLTFVIDGGGSVILTGGKTLVECPYTGTITGARVYSSDAASTAGDIVLDVLKDAATYPPTTSIVASAPPTLSSANNANDTTLTGWTTAVSAGDVLGVSVTSAATVTQVTLQLTLLVS